MKMNEISNTERRMSWEDDNELWMRNDFDGGGHELFEGTGIILQERLWGITTSSRFDPGTYRIIMGLIFAMEIIKYR
jgi:hypothetical protein